MTSKQCALIAAAAADSKKGTDIIIQRVAELLLVTDYFVIVSASNDRQVEAIADEVEEQLREKAGLKTIGKEGFDDRTWVLLDYGELVVHIFQQETREFYRLETIWNDAPLVDVCEAGIEDPQYSERIAKLVDCTPKYVENGCECSNNSECNEVNAEANADSGASAND